MEEFDVVIIGGGQAAAPLSAQLADAKKRVLICERRLLGGSCVNFGCTPSKAAIASARVAYLAREAARFGIVVPSVGVDFGAVLGRARSIADNSRAGVTKYIADHDVTVWSGHARFMGRSDEGFHISIPGREARARTVIINSGARTKVPEINGLAEVPYIHAGNWLQLGEIPDHVVFLGAGYIALEMAQFFRRMGSRVTVISPGNTVLSHEDTDVVEALLAVLEKEGIVFHLNARVMNVCSVREIVLVKINDGHTASTIVGSHVFIAAGRVPNTTDMGLETVGLSLAENGGIPTDEKLASKVAGIWVAGDARGREMFTHSAWDDHRVLASQLLGDGSRTTKNRIVPHALFTDPELGRVGMTEAEACRWLGEDLVVSRFSMDRNGRAVEEGETKGFIKLLADKRNGTLVGAAVLATHGAEIVSSYITLMNSKGTLSNIRNAIYIHPTLGEAMQSAVASFPQDLAKILPQPTT